MKTIKVNYETLDNASYTLCNAMADVCDELCIGAYDTEDWDYDDWKSNITDETIDEVFYELTDGLRYDDVDNMLADDDCFVETSWDGIDYSIYSADDLLNRIIDCAVEMFCM